MTSDAKLCQRRRWLSALYNADLPPCTFDLLHCSCSTLGFDNSGSIEFSLRIKRLYASISFTQVTSSIELPSKRLSASLSFREIFVDIEGCIGGNVVVEDTWSRIWWRIGVPRFGGGSWS